MTRISHTAVKFGFILACIACSAFLSGCSGMQPARPLVPGEADARWAQYLAASNGHDVPVAFTASVRYALPDKSGHRVLLTLWSNGGQPYRVDISAGFNTIVAKILESPDIFSMYVPSEETLYFYDGKGKPGLKLGRPVPFTPESIIRLLTGNYAEVFGGLGSDPRPESDAAISYLLTGDTPITDGARLTLNSQGLPTLWRDAAASGWKMEIEYDENPEPARRALPERITLTQPDGYEAVFLIKSRNYPEKPFSKEQLRLKMPPDTKIQPFSTTWKESI